MRGSYLDQEREIDIVALGRSARRLLVTASRNEINALQIDDLSVRGYSLWSKR